MGQQWALDTIYADEEDTIRPRRQATGYPNPREGRVLWVLPGATGSGAPGTNETSLQLAGGWRGGRTGEDV